MIIAPPVAFSTQTNSNYDKVLDELKLIFNNESALLEFYWNIERKNFKYTFKRKEECKKFFLEIGLRNFIKTPEEKGLQKLIGSHTRDYSLCKTLGIEFNSEYEKNYYKDRRYFHTLNKFEKSPTRVSHPIETEYKDAARKESIYSGDNFFAYAFTNVTKKNLKVMYENNGLKYYKSYTIKKLIQGLLKV